MSASEQITMEDEGGLSNDTNLRSPEEEAYQSLILLQQIHSSISASGQRNDDAAGNEAQLSNACRIQEEIRSLQLMLQTAKSR